MSEFTKEQIKAYYNWRVSGSLLPEDSPQNIQECAFHHVNCIDRIESLEAACSSCYDAQQRGEEYIATLEAQLKKGQYMVCDKHPFLTTASATGSALGCPYCVLAEMAALPEKWEQEDTGYYAEMRQCADQLTAILAKSGK